MGFDEQRRLDHIFEVDNIKMPIMSFIAPSVTLKAVAELGAKDKNGNKRRFFDETRYPSNNKYTNVSYLVSANIKINTYLVLEYPNPMYSSGQSTIRNTGMIIRGFAIEGLVETLRLFANNLFERFSIKKDGSVNLIADKAKSAWFKPNFQSTIEIEDAIYVNKSANRNEPGVRFILNQEYDFVVGIDTTLYEMIYRLSRIDLTSLGLLMVQSYINYLPGMATTELGSGYHGSSPYRPYWGDDPDDTINQAGAVKVNGRPTTKEGKLNEFFNGLG